ncbi:MAG: LysR family transcriptional regulator [Sandaracinaceae bacterium]
MRDLNDLDLNLLVALRALLEEGSVTGAARRLGLTQPAMSHRLKRLRDSLGDPLFVSSGRGLLPTPRAEAMRAPLEAALDALAGAVAEETFDPQTAVREFRVGTSDVGVARALPRAFARISREAAGITVSTHPVERGFAADLESGALDVAIGAGMPLPQGAKRLTLIEEGFVVLARRDHPVVKGRLDLDRYLRAVHVVVTPRGERGTFVDSALAARGHERRVRMRVRGFLSAAFVAARSDALLTAPESVAELMAPLLDLDAYPPPLPMPQVSVHMLWHARVHHAPDHVWLRRTVQELNRPTDGDPGPATRSPR